MARLDVEQLRFTYPGASEPTLHDVSFSVASGGSLALLGSSGAGKTTLLNLLSGLLPNQAGTISFDGEDAGSVAPAQRGVAQVFQFPVLYDSLSVLDNISFPLRTRGVGRRQRAARAQHIAELFDLSAVLALKPAALSLFQKQLVGFAKALVRDDLALVLLDEPLTAVEPAMKWRLRRAVKLAQAELAVTMVYVTHDQTEALTFADVVSVLHAGRVLQTGTPAELYQAPAHREVARFIGNPGMNLVPAQLARAAQQAAQTDAAIEVGFRPEWAELVTAGGALSSGADDALVMSGRITAQRLTGASADSALGIATVAVASGAGEAEARSVDVAGVLHHQVGEQVDVVVRQHQLFADGVLVAGRGNAQADGGAA